jgi:hypothetical protein
VGGIDTGRYALKAGSLLPIPSNLIEAGGMRKHLIIPDVQAREGVPFDHLGWIGRYICEKRPDVIVCLGDFADLPSLSHYDRGKLQFEGRRYKKDVLAARLAMRTLMGPLMELQAKQRVQKEKIYRPEQHLLLGNHEDHIQRAVNEDPKLDGLISVDDLEYEQFGWKVYPYLRAAVIDGVHYSHYFYLRDSGKPIGGKNLLYRLEKLCFSFVQGHQQGYMSGMKELNNGKRLRGIVAGSCYLHDEEYRGPQASNEWRGILLLHEVEDGDYGLCEVSLDYLCRKYEGCRVPEFMKSVYPDIFPTSSWAVRLAA